MALALSYAGIILVVVNDFSLQGANVALGTFWVFLSALFYAGYLLGSGRYVERLGSVRFACYASLVSCAAVVAHFFAASDAERLWTQPMPVYGLALTMALVSTVVPVVLTAEGIRRIGASHASMIGAVGPVATIGFGYGYGFLGVPITAVQLAGAALVLAGVLVISLQKK